MPWTVDDVEKHNKGLSPKKKQAWVKVANKALAACKDKIDGEPSDEQVSRCEASAIKQANAVVGNMGESDMALADIAQSAIEAARSFVSGGAELVEATGQEPKVAMNALLDRLQEELDAALLEPHEEVDMNEEIEEAKVSPAQIKAVLQHLMGRFGGDDEDEGDEDEAEEVAEVELSESASGAVIGLTEATPEGSAGVVPLNVDIAIIKPGWGNSRDKHYYKREALSENPGVFAGAKMYESDHRPDEKSTRTWVSTVKEVTGFTEEGAPIGRVAVHDESFAKRLLALHEAGLLHKMECSILGAGKVRKGEVDGEKANIVEAVTAIKSVDWVTRAGAGGHALNLAEKSGGDSEMTEEQKKEQEGQVEETQSEAEVHILSEDAVTSILDESSLPDAAKDKLKAAQYEDEEAVKEAVAAEAQYLKTVTEAGTPVTHEGREKVSQEPMSEADYQAAYDAIRARHGLAPLYGGESE